MGFFERFKNDSEEEDKKSEELIEEGAENFSEENLEGEVGEEEIEKLEKEIEDFSAEVSDIGISPEEKKLVEHLREEGSVIENILSKSPDGQRGWHKNFRGALAALSLFTAIGGSAKQAEGFQAQENSPRPEAVLVVNEFGREDFTGNQPVPKFRQQRGRNQGTVHPESFVGGQQPGFRQSRGGNQGTILGGIDNILRSGEELIRDVERTQRRMERIKRGMERIERRNKRIF